MGILQPIYDPALVAALPEEVQHLAFALLDETAQREFKDLADKQLKEKAEAESLEIIERGIERQQKAFENVRRRKEEALAVGTLSAEAEIFHELHLKPKLTEAHDFQPKIKTPIIQNLFNKNSLCWVVGSSGTFKSFVTADLAFRYGSEDMDYHGRKMTHGRSLIIVAEGAEGYAHRKTAWEREHDKTVKNVVIYPGALQLASVEKEMAALIHHLREEEAAGRPYGLIMIDTQAMCTVGVDENTSEMNQVINVLHRIRETSSACVMVVHHFGKDKRAGMRGSSMLYAAADTVLVLKRNDDSMDVTFSTAQADEGKQKEGINERDFLTLTLKVHTVGEDYFGDPVTSLVPLPGSSATASDDAPQEDDTPIPTLTPRQMFYLQELSAYQEDGVSASDFAKDMDREESREPAGGRVTRQAARKVWVQELKSRNLVELVPKQASKWRVTARGAAAIMRHLKDAQATGEKWSERAQNSRVRGRVREPYGEALPEPERTLSEPDSDQGEP